jgi:hypothetical protein
VRTLARWAKKENHHLTDQLLTLIEESPKYKMAFGFDKGDAGSTAEVRKSLITAALLLVCYLWRHLAHLGLTTTSLSWVMW